MVDVAEIKIWGEFVGAVRWDSDKQLASFAYHKKFLQKRWDLAPIKMPIDDGEIIYSFPELRPSKNVENTFKGLPGLLADALPDKYGNQLINIWLAQNGRPENSMNPVEQLCFIGKRGMGALEFEPAQLKSNKKSFDIELDSLVGVAKNILSKRKYFETNLNQDEQKALNDILKIGTSAGGARPKAVIAYNQQTGKIKSGQVTAPKGFEQWLLKLDGVSNAQFGETYGYGRVEYAYYLMAIDCGIDMMPSILLEENERAHFMTKRFDREKGNIKHHIQTFCGIQHYDYNNVTGYSYEQLYQTMRLLRLTYPEAEQMFRRMVFNVLATNNDDHTKNFAFLLKKDSKWQLAPAYDLCYSYDPTSIWVSQHALSINGKRKNISREDLLSIAKANSIKNPNKIIDEIKTIVCNWQEYAQKAGVNKKLKKAISQNLECFKLNSK
jgi:serine/threonine-protein kinase HipA